MSSATSFRSTLHNKARSTGVKRWARRALITGISAALLTACASSPTGRQQLKLFPSSEIDQMGVQSFAQMKEETPATNKTTTSQYVNCVANQVIAQVPAKYGIDNWEVVVFDSEQVNAFALPGGKVGVYTGLLEVAENQHQLAAVIGHELAHVLAEHGNERVSTAYATQTGLALAYKISGEPSEQKDQLFALLGIGSQVGVILPFGRIQESEADIIGLELMAEAGFQPEQAVSLWENMAKASGGQSQPELLSTHPSHDRRIKDLQKLMPKANALYEKAKAAGRVPNCTI
ncbi:M48 family metallopeptidase [Oceanospirillum sp.]|uniref:M48 family metallopeptidase n=1 Tax=Oceanospirillum sp. TaxID=2021254 RepID=UPI003A9155E2